MKFYNIEYIITFLLLLVPFGFIWYISFRQLRIYLKSALSYIVLILITLFGICVYFALMAAIVGKLRPECFIIIATSYGAAMSCYLLIIPSLILTSILTIAYSIKKHKRKYGA